MILFKRVVSLKNIFINKSHWLHTLKINTICKSLAEVGQEFMKESFNRTDSTDFLEKKMLTSSFSFPSTNFHKLYYLKRTLFRLKKYHELSRIFLCPTVSLMSWILKTSEFKFKTERFWRSTWFWWTLWLFVFFLESTSRQFL